jgi:predicted RNA-binding protein
MCELSVYIINVDKRQKLRDRVIRLIAQDGNVLMQGIFGDSAVVEGKLAEVDVISQTASIVAA